jgi:predicted HTH domain antitoxin
MKECFMDQNIAVTYPVALAFSLKMQDEEFCREMKTLSMVKLYELGKVSSGMAAKVLGIPRLSFLDILSDYHISVFADADELEADYAAAKGSF